MTRTTFMPAIVLLIGLCGCAGSRQRLYFDTVTVPVSLSSSVLDKDGTIVPPSRLKHVARFEGTFTGWSMFWTLLPLSRIDLSEAINQRVKEFGGDAVMRLRCRADPGGITLLNYPIWINQLPFWPGVVKVTVDADIVKVIPRTVSEAAPATPLRSHR